MTPNKPSNRKKTISNYDKPKWPLWLNMGNIELWQSVALSCNIDPDDWELTNIFGDAPTNVGIHFSFYGTADHLTDCPDRGDEFREYFARRRIAESRLPTGKIKLADLAKLGLELGWEMPPEMVQLAQPPAPTQEAVPALPIGERREETLLKIIAALALALAEKSPKLNHGGKPNATQIHSEIKKHLHLDDNRHGVSPRNVSDAITKGLKLLKK